MNLLLIDDDYRIISFVKRGLEAEGFRIDVAGDGETGLELARRCYDLIILDLLLPGKSGNEICHTLRQERVQTPILMLTAKDAIEDKVEGFQTGADDYLTKPFAFEELLARIQALLRRGEYQELATELRVGDLTLNIQTREVARAGRSIHLTGKEFGLLQYLMSHPNRALSRTRILEHVWGYHHDTQTNVIDVYIRSLRTKVDRGHARQLIQTIRDVGYKIAD